MVSCITQFSFSNPEMGKFDICRHLLISGLLIYVIFISLPNDISPLERSSFSRASSFFSSSISKHDSSKTNYPTNLSHLVFGLVGSEGGWHHRKAYIESWWRPNVTRGFLYLDTDPKGDLLPWSDASPPYRVSDNLTEFLEETKAAAPIMIRMVHGIIEVFRELGDENLRWLVMGDDDSIFFVDNMVDVLAQYDHTKYHYLGGLSEFIMSNHWFSFDQGFGGAGFMLSYPLAKALAEDMENCLRRHAQIISADTITMACIADIGANLSPQKGIHQIDLHGDISGFLSSHPKSPLLTLHHFDMVEPIFPTMDRFESLRHLMKAAAADQSRMLQQTICHQKQNHWSFSISWGYSAHIYERVMPRFHLQKPIETFQIWAGEPRPPPQYMFNTRLPSKDSCEAPHVFFFQGVEKTSMGEILTVYSRAAPRGLPPCGDHAADFVSEIRVFSSAAKRKEMGRSECCDIVVIDGGKVEVKFRECRSNETIV